MHEVNVGAVSFDDASDPCHAAPPPHPSARPRRADCSAPLPTVRDRHGFAPLATAKCP